MDGGANQEPVDLTAMMAQSRPGLARSAAHNREQRGWAQQVLRRLTVEVAARAVVVRALRFCRRRAFTFGCRSLSHLAPRTWLGRFRTTIGGLTPSQARAEQRTN